MLLQCKEEMNKLGHFAGELPLGKLPPDVLEQKILSFSGAPRPEVLVGPGVGEDASVIDLFNGKYLVVASDPIVGASHDAGKLLVNVNVNDVACKGGDPAYMLLTILVPRNEGLPFAEKIMEEIHHACKEMNISIVGGHTEITDRYDQPVLVGTIIGTTEYLYRAQELEAGDHILMTKHAAIEGMSIIASDRHDLLEPFLDREDIELIRSWSTQLSVYPESLLLRDLAKFMHDPTEGGIKGGLAEIQRLSGLGVILHEEMLPVHPLTRRVVKELNFDPLNMISSGVMLAAVNNNNKGKALKRLEEKGIPAAIIGVLVPPGEGEELDTHEELWKVLEL